MRASMHALMDTELRAWWILAAVSQQIVTMPELSQTAYKKLTDAKKKAVERDLQRRRRWPRTLTGCCGQQTTMTIWRVPKKDAAISGECAALTSRFRCGLLRAGFSFLGQAHWV